MKSSPLAAVMLGMFAFWPCRVVAKLWRTYRASFVSGRVSTPKQKCIGNSR